jgi:hypothetical protein
LLYRHTDALFDLTDAILTASVVPSPVHLSLQEGVHRRGWGSLYAALSSGRVDQEALRQLVVGHPLQEDRAGLYGLDMSFWPPMQCGGQPQRPPKRFGTFARTGHARQAAETLWTLTGASQRSPLGPGKALCPAIKKTT